MNQTLTDIRIIYANVLTMTLLKCILCILCTYPLQSTLQVGRYIRTEQDVRLFGRFYALYNHVPHKFINLYINRSFQNIQTIYADLLNKKALIVKYAPDLLRERTNIKHAKDFSKSFGQDTYMAYEFCMINVSFAQLLKGSKYLGVNPKPLHDTTHYIEIGINPKYFNDKDDVAAMLDVMPAHVIATIYSDKPSRLAHGRIGTVAVTDPSSVFVPYQDKRFNANDEFKIQQAIQSAISVVTGSCLKPISV